MTMLFTIGILLILTFGFAVSAYLSFFSFNLKNTLAKGLIFLVFGLIISLATFSISLMIVWPGAM